MRDQPIERIMTTPAVVIGPEASIDTARRLMASKAIHHLPVVEGDRLVGILGAAEVQHAPPGATVGQVMQPKPVSISLRATLLDAAKLLATGMFHSLPVTAPGGALVGVVTSTDLITELLQQLPSAEAGHEVPARASVQFTDADTLAGVMAVAERRHLAGDDPEQLAAAVLYLHAKARLLETTLRAADLYLHSGQGEREHAALLRAVACAKEGIRPDLKIGRL
jgi:predicted transcriptional regulator